MKAARNIPSNGKRAVCFSTPINTWHQHFNAQGSEPVRLISLTDAPVVINRYRNLDYI